MLGEDPFASRRNLFGLWNQILPELTIGLFSILTFFSSWKSAWSCGAAARFSRIRPSNDFKSAGESGPVPRHGGQKTKKKGRPTRRLNNFRMVVASRHPTFTPP